MHTHELYIRFDSKNKAKDYEHSFYKYKRKKHKTGFDAVYITNIDRESKRLNSGSKRLNKYPKLECLESFKEFKNEHILVKISESNFDKNWLSFWNKQLKVLYRLFTDITEKEINLFTGPYDIQTFHIAYNILSKQACIQCEGDEKLLKKYYKWYKIIFDYSTNNIFTHEEFRKGLNKKHIYNDYWSHEGCRIIMFLKEITPRSLTAAMKRYRYLIEVENNLGKKLNKYSKDFFNKNRQWKKLP